ncbi:leucine-rich repeat domain-containing protein [Arcicella aquatica]|uniref:Leucine-rich repeat domain-containing protein n=1 Tax=Arcicella aquatica TaxID=217141 RepID=A0ABU5QUQ5_9BACT|nr:leucine-rich repeat domain-containing protein [Arcicella aquatica]MEA5260836.1 leucine-rich repeat domain-containing protein [Arcicella aquatica]
MKKHLLICLLLLKQICCLSQHTDSTFYSLEEANKAPLSVKKLIIKHKNYKSIPKDIFKYSNLTELTLHNTNIKRIPKEIQYLQNLEYLNLSYNRIRRVDPSITKLKKLKLLNLSNNNLKQLPEAILSLKYLENLIISENKITFLILPSSYGLKSLNANFNKIDTLREELFERYCKLEDVSFVSNLIRNIPYDIYFARGLKYINLTNNRIKFIPEEVLLLKHLEELRVGKNLLQELPDVTKKSYIKVLDLSENPLRSKIVRLFKEDTSIPLIIFNRRLNNYEYMPE